MNNGQLTWYQRGQLWLRLGLRLLLLLLGVLLLWKFGDGCCLCWPPLCWPWWWRRR